MRIPLLALAAFLASILPSSAQFASAADRQLAVDHYRAGQELASTERFEQAAEEFQRAIERDPLLTLAYYSLGQANMELRRYASAIRAFSDCIEASRTLYGLSERNRVEVEWRRDEEIRELEDWLRRLQTMNRNRQFDLRISQTEIRIADLRRQRTNQSPVFTPPAEVLLSLGSAHFRSGELEAAEQEWKAAVRINGKLGEGFNNLAALYAMTGRKREAEDAVRAAERSGFRVHPQLKEDIRKMS